MSEVTHDLKDAVRGDGISAQELLPLVYNELRQLAAARIANEAADQTLQPTALVHEAYLRLVGSPGGQEWDGRGHFFAPAAEAMRRILVERARRRARIKHGGEFQRVDFTKLDVAMLENDDAVLAVSEALEKLADDDATSAE